jgi:hypothetical protein
MHKFKYEYTDGLTVGRGAVYVPELTHYGYTGSTDGTYRKANKAQTREVMRQVKAELGLTGAKGVRETWVDIEVFKPYGMATILFIEFDEEDS